MQIAGKTNTLNVDGKAVPQKGYITDELTDYAIDWMDTLDKAGPKIDPQTTTALVLAAHGKASTTPVSARWPPHWKGWRRSAR